MVAAMAMNTHHPAAASIALEVVTTHTADARVGSNPLLLNRDPVAIHEHLHRRPTICQLNTHSSA